MKQFLTQDRLTLSNVVRFTWPSVMMVVMMSVYSLVDAIFVARVVGPNGLASVNIVVPLWGVFGALGVMMGSGGCAVVARHMGQGLYRRAGASLALIYSVTIALGIILAISVWANAAAICRLLGATDLLVANATAYLRALALFVPVFILQMLGSFFLVAAGKQVITMWLAFVSGLLNVGLDYLLMVELGWGTTGAGVATGVSALIPATFGLTFFLLNRGKQALFFLRPRWHLSTLIDSATNGSSEMVGSLAYSVTTFLYNLMALRYLGEIGVTAIATLLYMEYFLSSVFFGFAQGISPLISFLYGAQAWDKIAQVKRLSLGLILTLSLPLFVGTFAYPQGFIRCFVDEGNAVFGLATHALRLFSIAFLFVGLNVFASAYLTALSKGFLSAFLAFSRSLVLLSLTILLLPLLFAETGLWLAAGVAESLAAALAIYVLHRSSPAGEGTR